MYLTNQILRELRHGVAKNGYVVMSRFSCDALARMLGVPYRSVSVALYALRKDGRVSHDLSNKGDMVYWRKGHRCV